VGAAVQGTVCLYTVADDPDAAVLAGRSERVDRALEAVEHVVSPRRKVFPETGLPEMPILRNSRV
jgi:hypothetical protein